MARIILSLLLIFSIAGCSGFGKPKDIIYVDIPILYCPAPQDVDVPILDTDLLTTRDSGDYEKIVKAYASTIVRLKAYTNKLESQLDIYKGLNNAVTDQ